MPTYQYTCTDCGEQVEAVQKFSDDPLTVCPHCEGKLRKVFSPVGIVFKGSGFYRTDSRNGSVSAESSKDKASNGSGKSSGLREVMTPWSTTTGGIFPFCTSIFHVGLDRFVRRHLATLGDAGLDQEPRRVADSGDDLLGLEEVLDEF